MSRLKTLLRILTLRCEEASILSSRELDEALGLPERLALLGHRLSCRSCRRFGQQIRYLHRALGDRPRRAVGDEVLSHQARSRIQRSIAGSNGDESPAAPPE